MIPRIANTHSYRFLSLDSANGQLNLSQPFKRWLFRKKKTSSWWNLQQSEIFKNHKRSGTVPSLCFQKLFFQVFAEDYFFHPEQFARENGWLEYEFPFEAISAYFQG